MRETSEPIRFYRHSRISLSTLDYGFVILETTLIARDRLQRKGSIEWGSVLMKGMIV